MLDPLLHFTYNACGKKPSSLKQGDILQKTPELLQMLKDVHPHYTNDEYKYFQIITQSCDLVRRNGDNCKSHYITLAAVRSLDDIIDRYIADNASAIEIENVLYCAENQKAKVVEFLSRLFNNNEKEYFFLERSPEHGIAERCCTLLYLSIAIRSREHYNLCLDAKCLELADNFQSKLGWLVGNLYSRVGTDDYVPTAVPTAKLFQSLLQNIVEDHAAWVPQKRFPEFKKVAETVRNLEQINSLIEINLNKKKDDKMSSVLRQVKSIIALSSEDEKKFVNLISQDAQFQKLLS